MNTTMDKCVFMEMQLFTCTLFVSAKFSHIYIRYLRMWNVFVYVYKFAYAKCFFKYVEHLCMRNAFTYAHKCMKSACVKATNLQYKFTQRH